jgi:hypothetical protein
MLVNSYKQSYSPILFLMAQFQGSDATCSCSANICNFLATELQPNFKQVQTARGAVQLQILLSIT